MASAKFPYMDDYIAQLGTPPTFVDAIRERNAWVETAVQFQSNEEYYCSLLDQIAEIIGDEAWTAKDGSRYPRTEEPVRARLPELVAKRLAY